MLLTALTLLLAAEPDPLVAELGTRKINASELGSDRDDPKLAGILLAALTGRFVVEQKLEPTPAELEAFERSSRESTLTRVRKVRRAIDALEARIRASPAKRPDLESELKDQRQQLRDLTTPAPAGHLLAHEFVLAFKLQQALHRHYGGTIIFQQSGPEAYGAYAPFLESEERAGHFRVLDPAARTALYDYLRRPSAGIAIASDSLDQPFWLSPKP